MTQLSSLIKDIKEDSWRKIILDFFNENVEIATKLQEIFKKDEKSILPPLNNIFRCFNYFPIAKTKVVILGQDPYPNKNDACGLAFSVERKNNLPHSLKNIFLELKNDIGIIRNDGNLESWAKQGVLLLNTALTISVSNEKKIQHFDLWDKFTKYILNTVSEINKDVLFILWGRQSWKYEFLFENKENIFKSGHPSFASVHKSFFNTKPFSWTNKRLKDINESDINWD